MAQGFFSTAKAWFDDLYIATTPARIEICNADIYELCTIKHIQYVASAVALFFIGCALLTFVSSCKNPEVFRVYGDHSEIVERAMSKAELALGMKMKNLTTYGVVWQEGTVQGSSGWWGEDMGNGEVRGGYTKGETFYLFTRHGQPQPHNDPMMDVYVHECAHEILSSHGIHGLEEHHRIMKEKGFVFKR